VKLYRIQIDLPGSNDEFWEEIDSLNAPDAKQRLALEIEEWINRGGLLNASVKVTDIFATEPLKE